MYFKNFNWSKNGLIQFLHSFRNNIKILYDINNVIVMDVNCFEDCHKLLGDGEMKNMCYSNIIEYWNRYLYSQTCNKPNKHLVIFNFNKKRSEDESHISSIAKIKNDNRYYPDRNLTNLHNYSYIFPIPTKTLTKLLQECRTAKATPIQITHDELVQKHIEYFGF